MRLLQIKYKTIRFVTSTMIESLNNCVKLVRPKGIKKQNKKLMYKDFPSN